MSRWTPSWNRDPGTVLRLKSRTRSWCRRSICGSVMPFSKRKRGGIMNTTAEVVKLYAKQLKIPSFADYEEIPRQADPSLGFGGLLVELMKAEDLSRQENQNRRRLKAAGFPYLKTLEEFDCSQLNIDRLTFRSHACAAGSGLCPRPAP